MSTYHYQAYNSQYMDMPRTQTWMQHDYHLTGCNTLGVPCVAECYATPTDLEQLQESLAFAKKRNMPITILGAGSNVILPEYLSGMVLRPMFSGIRALKKDAHHIIVEVGASESWAGWVRYSLRKRWYGLENLAAIPGSVGAAPVQNIGAYGVELASYLSEIVVVDSKTAKVQILRPADCDFSYRKSAFRERWHDSKIIIAVRMRLLTKAKPHTEYAVLRQHLEKKATATVSALHVYRSVVSLRRRLPDVLDEPNVGSFFVNPELDRPAYERLLKTCPDIKAWPRPKGYMRVSAGDLLERCGWKGKVYKQVRVHSRHALVIINDQYQSGAAVMRCAQAMRESVAQRFSIDLAIEPRVLVAP